MWNVAYACGSLILVALLYHLLTSDPEHRAITGKSALCLIMLIVCIPWCLPPVPVRHRRLATPKLSVKERRRERDQRRNADKNAAAAETLVVKESIRRTLRGRRYV